MNMDKPTFRFLISKRPPKTTKQQQQYALQAVECARTYWTARQDGRAFIYAGGNTFLNGSSINDAAGAGMIDCSTYIYLVLCGVNYEGSPYSSGKMQMIQAWHWGDQMLLKNAGSEGYRYAADLARYFFRKKCCFTDRSCLQPGDLTFHSARKTSRFMSITHIGVIADDVDFFYNVTNLDRVVVRSHLSARKDIIFYARPDYKSLLTLSPDGNLP